MQIETLAALYAAEDYPLLSSEKLFRVQYAGNRHYVRENGEMYRSLTTLLKNVEFAKEARWLHTWRDEMEAKFGDAEQVEQYVQHTADYGTALHITIANAVRAGFIDWLDLFDEYLPIFTEQVKDSQIAYTMCRQLQYDVASVLKFFSDYKVQVLAIELPVWSKDGYATLIDLVGTMNVIPGWMAGDTQLKRVPFIGDFKSGRKGFHASHEMQLIGCRKAFNEVFGSIMRIEQIVNIAPKAHTGEEVLYNMKNWTEHADKNKKDELFDSMLQTARLAGVLTDPKFMLTEFSGQTKIGDDPSASIRFIEYSSKARSLTKTSNQ
jgi:hypothetical protein